MTLFDKNSVSDFSDRIVALLNKEFLEYNFKIKGGTFGPTDFTMKLNCVIKGEDDQYAIALKAIAASLNIDLEKVHDDMKLIGYNSRRWKKPFILKNIKTGQQKIANDLYIERYFTK